MSRRKRCRSDATPDPAGREKFVRANAVVLVAERDVLIARLRRQVTELLHSKRALRAELARLRSGAP